MGKLREIKNRIHKWGKTPANDSDVIGCGVFMLLGSLAVIYLALRFA